MKTITIRLCIDDLEFLKKEAKRLRVSISDVVRMRLAQTICTEVQAV